MPQILVVEDSKDAQELIRRALRDAGDVAFAESGSECVELASTQPPISSSSTSSSPTWMASSSARA
ncbi:MAG: response regulator [Myxococcota bacterium]